MAFNVGQGMWNIMRCNVPKLLNIDDVILVNEKIPHRNHFVQAFNIVGSIGVKIAESFGGFAENQQVIAHQLDGLARVTKGVFVEPVNVPNDEPAASRMSSRRGRRSGCIQLFPIRLDTCPK